jgi:hypothetical protein
MRELKKSKEKEDVIKASEIREKNLPLTELFKNKTGEENLENYPQEIDYYLESEEKKLTELKKEQEEIKQKIKNSSGTDLEENLRRKNNLEQRIKKMNRERNKNNVFTRYLTYISNNERLWATMVYIFLSSFLISQIFPRDKTVLLRLHSLTEESRNRGLKLLEKFSPVYYTVHRRKGESEEVIHVVNCHLSK